MAEDGNRIGALLAGAALMYLLDPDRGRRRRAALRDRFVHLSNLLDDTADTAGRDFRNRLRGAGAELRARFRRDDAGPEVITERVRARLGRVVSHPGALEAVARDGQVVLSGPIFSDEADDALENARAVRGVDEVVDRLDRHDRAENVPGLQGGRRFRLGQRPEFLQEYWAPAARVLGVAAGGTLALTARRMRGPLRYLLGAAGVGLTARALTNLGTDRLTGIRAGRRAIDVQKSINVDAPVEEVFRFWSRFENFPRFMAHVQDVRDVGGGRSHWVAEGPAGLRAEWDAEVTAWTPNECIGWRSTPGSMVGTAGWVRFQPNERDGTRVDVHLVYNPPAGAIGHAVARLFGTDPKRAMDEDLIRFKSLIEGGRTSVEGRTVEMRDLAGTTTDGRRRGPSTGSRRPGED